MKTFFKQYTLLFILLFLGCKTEELSLEEMDLTLSEKIEKSINPAYLSPLRASKEDVEWLKETYANYSNQPLWINDTLFTLDGKEMNLITTQTQRLALPLNRYNFLVYNDTFSLFQKEQYTTLLLSYLLNDLKQGVLDTLSKQLRPPTRTASNELLTFIKNKKPQSTWEDYFFQSINLHPKFNATWKGINHFVKRYPLDTTSFNIESMKEDSVLTYETAKIALLSKGYIDSTNLSNSLIIDAIKQFQLENGLKNDGIIGTYTAKALNESNLKKYERALLALEKWRWKTDLPDQYIWVNIPAYELNFYVNDSLKRVHKVVVGANVTKTPVFNAKMKTVVSYPFWHIPYSIASTEILYGAKKDTNYFAKKGYKIFRDGAEVDPKTVDWSVINQTNFRYRVRQDGGASNSLGLVKMLFPNKHSVYIHDTPAKRFFLNDVRAYSHGCIRCENPKDLAKYILELDNNSFTPDSLDALINRKQMQQIALKKPFDVFIDYISVSTDKNNDLKFYVDIYSKDEKWLKLMRVKPYRMDESAMKSETKNNQ